MWLLLLRYDKNRILIFTFRGASAADWSSLARETPRQSATSPPNPWYTDGRTFASGCCGCLFGLQAIVPHHARTRAGHIRCSLCDCTYAVDTRAYDAMAHKVFDHFCMIAIPSIWLWLVDAAAAFACLVHTSGAAFIRAVFVYLIPRGRCCSRAFSKTENIGR